MYWLNRWLVCITVAVEIHRICFFKKYFQLVSQHSSQFSKQQEENVDTTILEGLKTRHILNVIYVEFFCVWFPAIDLETVLQVSIPKFKDNRHFSFCYRFISSLSFTLGYLASILFIWLASILFTYLTHYPKKVLSFAFWNNSCGP